jgi:hypothetical protein
MSALDKYFLIALAAYLIGGFIEYIRPDGSYELQQENRTLRRHLQELGNR